VRHVQHGKVGGTRDGNTNAQSTLIWGWLEKRGEPGGEMNEGIIDSNVNLEKGVNHAVKSANRGDRRK